MNTTPRLRLAAESAIDTLMREIKGVKAVVISTEDGLELAARVENTAQVARLSAIASSLAALGAVAGEESQLGQCDNVAIEATHGHILMLQARGHQPRSHHRPGPLFRQAGDAAAAAGLTQGTRAHPFQIGGRPFPSPGWQPTFRGED